MSAVKCRGRLAVTAGGTLMSKLCFILVVLQLMTMAGCVIDVDDRFTDPLPSFSDIGGQF